MHALWISLAWLSGVFAFAFLLGGVVGLQDVEPPKDRLGKSLQVIDLIFLGGLGSMVSDTVKNWETQAEKRSLIWSGLAFLAATVLFAFLASHTA
jgi:hypothetical protein